MKRKPKVAEKSPIRVDRDGYVRCRVCGCTEREPCNPPCAWFGGEDLCTICAMTAECLREWREAAHRPNMTALLREARRPL